MALVSGGEDTDTILPERPRAAVDHGGPSAFRLSNLRPKCLLERLERQLLIVIGQAGDGVDFFVASLE